MNQESRSSTLETNGARKVSTLPEKPSEQKKSGRANARSHWEWKYFHSEKKNEYSKVLPNILAARNLHYMALLKLYIMENDDETLKQSLNSIWYSLYTKYTFLKEATLMWHSFMQQLLKSTLLKVLVHLADESEVPWEL